MGKSFIEFKKYGFWIPDGVLLDWLEAALAEIDKVESPQTWEIEMRSKLQDAITRAFPGGVNPKLDVFLTGEERIRFMVSLSKKISELATNPDLKLLSGLFIDLIEGRLKTTVSSPIDYW